MLYRQLYEDLLAAIRGGDYAVGDRIPTEAELRAQYSVSAITVRRALDMLRQDGYVERRPRIGTTVISTEPTRQTQQIGSAPVVGLVLTSFDDTFGARLLEGALDAAQGEAHLVVERTRGDLEREAEAIAAVLDAGAQALVLLPSSSAMIPPPVLGLVTQSFPVVMVDRRFEGVPVATVTSDNISAGSTATEHLFELGHRRVALVTSDSSVTSNDDRRRGWVGAHARNKVTLDDDLAFHEIESTLPGSSASREDDVKRLEAFVAEHPDVTGYVAGEYNIALILRDALHLAGRRIPADVSVVCFDHPDAWFDTELFRFTHVAQDQATLGGRAVASALRQIRDGAGPEKVVVPTTFVVGASTAAAPTRAPRAAPSPSGR
ncbi:GntR family transcriptional regulator [Luteimicrobium sp. DT211]|uniref:GntR family transcriptional regulator n=1 Tax=Luteimicrobium sp. DT211 TaxID=3393412 RepID=UPI003CE67AF4